MEPLFRMCLGCPPGLEPHFPPSALDAVEDVQPRPLTVCLSRLTSIFSAAYPLANADMHTSCSFVYSAPSARNTLPALSAWPSPRHVRPLKGPDLPLPRAESPTLSRTFSVTTHSPALEPSTDSTALIRRQAGLPFSLD